MSGNLNKAQLIGHLGGDPEVRYMPNGHPVANMSVATTETWKDKETGERKEHTEWHRVVMYRGLAEVAAEYLRKGSLVYIEGRLRTRKWKDKEGNERSTTEITCDAMKMLGGKRYADRSRRDDDDRGPARSSTSRRPPTDDFDDDIPF